MCLLASHCKISEMTAELSKWISEKIWLDTMVNT